MYMAFGSVLDTALQCSNVTASNRNSKIFHRFSLLSDVINQFRNILLSVGFFQQPPAIPPDHYTSYPRSIQHDLRTLIPKPNTLKPELFDVH